MDLVQVSDPTDLQPTLGNRPRFVAVDSRDHEQAQGLGGVVGLLEMEKLKFQDPGKQSLDR
jgi:hypothetical protein